MLGRGFSRYLPPAIRRKTERTVQRFRLRNAPDFRKTRQHKDFSGACVAVAGLFNATTGLSRAAELVALTLESRGHRVWRVDLSEVLGLQTMPSRQDCLRPDDCKNIEITDVVFVINPDHAPYIAFDSAWLVDRCVIGHWIWEIEALPSFWRLAVKSYDEIWVPTQLVRDVITTNIPNLEIPVKIVPYGIDLDPILPVSITVRSDARSRFRIPKDVFIVGYSFAVDSNYYRKNPEDAVRAFKRAFPSMRDHSVRLFLRCKDLANRPHERAGLQKLIDGDQRIRIFDANHSISIVDFYATIDVYLSTSRAEGYGLNLVEASQAGLPVIASGWRIAPEISTLPGVQTTGFQLIPLNDPQGHYAGLRGAAWAAPDLSEMSDLLKSERQKFIVARCAAKSDND